MTITKQHAERDCAGVFSYAEQPLSNVVKLALLIDSAQTRSNDNDANEERGHRRRILIRRVASRKCCEVNAAYCRCSVTW